MSTCNIKIYRTQLTPSRNALVDNLEGYLGTLTPIYSNPSFQYQQLGLDLTIKVNVDQSKITESSIGNYVRMEQDGRIWYYFILGAQWKGKKVVQLALSIDSINTFRNDLHWTEKTTIARQHGDRFYKQINNSFIRRIDEEGEGILAEKYLLEREPILINDEETKWYLIYKTRDNLSPDNYDNPITCYLCADQPIPYTKSSGEGLTINTDIWVTGNYYYFNYIDNPGGRVTIFDQEFELGKTYEVATDYAVGTGYRYANRVLNGIVVYKDEEGFRYGLQWNQSVYAVDGSLVTDGFQTTTASGAITSEGKINPYRCLSEEKPLSYQEFSSITINQGEGWRFGMTLYLIAEQSLPLQSFYSTRVSATQLFLSDIRGIDRTDSRIMKILELPYPPCNVSIIDGIYQFPNEWQYDSGLLKLNQLHFDFTTQIGKLNLKELEATIPAYTPRAKRNIAYESKFYHSEFYTYKAVYDSFAKEIRLEHIKPSIGNMIFDSEREYIPVFFKPTNTINSKMAFKFDTDYLKLYQFATYRKYEDYEDYLLVSRNNEVPIYSNDYINYIRTGYNYDLKAQELAKTQAAWNIAIEGASLATSIAGGYISAAGAVTRTAYDIWNKNYEATPQQTLKADPAYWNNDINKLMAEERAEAKSMLGGSSLFGVQAISRGASFAGTIANSIFSQLQATNQMKAKLSTLAAQSTGVAGSDDVDLLGWYNSNKLEIIKYDTRQYQKEAIADLFHYCGYNHPHMEYPDTTSRIWFNYIQCNPDFYEQAYTPFKQYIEDIKAKYNSGVTVYHCNENEWDWDQEYENWESVVYPNFTTLTTDMIQGFRYKQAKITYKYIGRVPLETDNNSYIEIQLLDNNKNVIYQIRKSCEYNTEYTINGVMYPNAKYIRYRLVGNNTTPWAETEIIGG